MLKERVSGRGERRRDDERVNVMSCVKVNGGFIPSKSVKVSCRQELLNNNWGWWVVDC